MNVQDFQTFIWWQYHRDIFLGKNQIYIFNVLNDDGDSDDHNFDEDDDDT